MASAFNQFVGATGFEPAAAWSQTRSATGLRYTPKAQHLCLASAKVEVFRLTTKCFILFFIIFVNTAPICSSFAPALLPFRHPTVFLSFQYCAQNTRVV